MDRQPVASSNLASIGYDAGQMILEVEFLNGRVYQYQGVPEYVFHEMLGAPSKGSYLNQVVKNNYPVARLV